MVAFRRPRVRLIATVAALATLIFSMTLVHPNAQARPRQGVSLCATPQSREIISDTVWTAEGGPYLISNCTVKVTTPATLTILSGAKILMDEQGRLDVAGGLRVQGTSPGDVLFTSNKTPVGPGDYVGLQILPGASAHLSGFTIQYANRTGAQAAMLVQAAGTVIENGLIEQSRLELPAVLIDRTTDVTIKNVTFKQNGLAIEIRQITDQTKLSTVTLTDNRFENNGNSNGGVLSMDANVQLNMSGNQASGNTVNGVFVKPGTMNSAIRWMGGDFPYVIGSLVTIQNQGKLDIDAKAIVKFREGVQGGLQMTRGGSLNVNGAGDGKVIFTSLADDEACISTVISCDTNNDTSQSTPAKGAWSKLEYRPDSTGGKVDHAELRYGGDPALAVSKDGVSVSHSKLINGSGVGIQVNGPTVPMTASVFASITDNSFVKNQTTGLALVTGSGAQPYIATVTGNTFEQNAVAVSFDAEVQLESSGNSTPGDTNGLNAYRINGGRMRFAHRFKAGDLPFVLASILTLAERAAILTLDPGLTLKIMDNAAINTDLGQLLIGSPNGEKVLITSVREDACSAARDTGCDTNGDGARTSPIPGDWERISVAVGSQGAFVYNTVLRYGGGRAKGSMIELRHPNSQVWGNELAQSSGVGLFVRQANTTIKGNYFHDNSSHAIQLEGLAINVGVTLEDNRIENNGGAAIDMDANCELTFKGNNVVKDNKLNGVSVHGDSLQTRTWKPGALPFVVTGSIDVKGSAQGSSTLFIAPGTVVKLGPGVNISTSRGKLVAEGTPDQPIIFTSLKDDSVGGDVQPDVTNSPNAGDWGGIQLSAGGVGSRLKNVEIRYSGGSQKPAVTVLNADVSLTDSVLRDGGGTGVQIDYSPLTTEQNMIKIDHNQILNMHGYGVQIITRSHLEPTITRNTISGSTQAAILMDANVEPVLKDASGTRNTVTNNEINAVVVAGNVTVNRRWQAGDMPYVLDQNVTIGADLDIEAGAVIKAQLGARMTVDRGTLKIPANGSGDAVVTFTSIRDDTCGAAEGVCDTLSDNEKTPTTPRPGDWGGLSITAGSGASRPVQLTGIRIYYGGTYDAAVVVRRFATQFTNADIAYSASDGLAILQGKSISLRDSLVRDNFGIGLRIEGTDTAATIEHNIFTGNKRSISHRSPGNVQTADNVAVGNGADAMLYCANVTVDQAWHNDLARELSCEVKVDNSAELNIDPGTVLKFGIGTGLRVQTRKLGAIGVIFASNQPNPQPGSWNNVTFEAGTFGEVKHSVFSNAGSAAGSIEMKSSDVSAKYNLIIRSSRIGVRVTTSASPVIEGNIIRQTTGVGGVSVQVIEKAKPQILSNRIAESEMGVNINSGGVPRLSGNSFFNLPQNAVRNTDSSNCVSAQKNWWGDSTGPQDIKLDSRDPCGPNLRNVDGKGISVSDYVDYTNWLAVPPPTAPLVDLPRCGFTNQTQVKVSGTTSPNIQVSVYDDDKVIGTVTATANGHFEGNISLAKGPHKISFEATSDGNKSPRSGFRLVQVDDSVPVDPSGIFFSYGARGTEQHQPLRDESGCATRCGGASGGRVTLPPGVEVVVNVPISGSPGTVEFVQDGRPPVRLTPSAGNLYSSPPFKPAQGNFRIRYGSGTSEFCMGYIYLGASGVVYADTGVQAPPVISYDFESGDQGWGGEWARTTELAHGGQYSFTDSPNGKYQAGKTYTMQMIAPVDLRGVVAPTLRFWHRFRLAAGDTGYVEARRNSVEGWKILGTYREINQEWHREQVNLDEFTGEYSLYVRFRLTTSSTSKLEDGWYVDDVEFGSGGSLNKRYDEGEPLIAGATVMLRQRNPDTGEWAQWDGAPTGQSNPQLTDESGRYGFYGLPPTEYQVLVSAAGLGLFSSPTMVVWNGTFAENAPLAGGQLLFIPYTAKITSLK